MTLVFVIKVSSILRMWDENEFDLIICSIKMHLLQHRSITAMRNQDTDLAVSPAPGIILGGKIQQCHRLLIEHTALVSQNNYYLLKFFNNWVQFQA